MAATKEGQQDLFQDFVLTDDDLGQLCCQPTVLLGQVFGHLEVLIVQCMALRRVL